MPVTREDLLASVRRRQTRSRLTTADRYLHSMGACFDGRTCPERLFDHVTRRDWEHELKEAESKLVYCAETIPMIGQGGGQAHELPLTDGAVLDFEAVVTTTRRDRDGDILESAGAHVDPAAVLLWQHIPFQPIGRMIEVTEQSAQRVKARLSIADTELGRDAATLAAFGAVKISHGFEPSVFEPLPDDGWHIKRFEIFEISLVSIPSNRDAVVTAFSRRKLNSPFFREWARTLYRDRKVQGIGAELGGGRTECTRNPAAREHRRTARVALERTPRIESDADSSAVRPSDALWDSCRRFVARASLAEAGDLDALRQTRDTLAKVIEYVESF